MDKDKKIIESNNKVTIDLEEIVNLIIEDYLNIDIKVEKGESDDEEKIEMEVASVLRECLLNSLSELSVNEIQEAIAQNLSVKFIKKHNTDSKDVYYPKIKEKVYP